MSFTGRTTHHQLFLLVLFPRVISSFSDVISKLWKQIAEYKQHLEEIAPQVSHKDEVIIMQKEQIRLLEEETTDYKEQVYDALNIRETVTFLIGVIRLLRMYPYFRLRFSLKTFYAISNGLFTRYENLLKICENGFKKKTHPKRFRAWIKFANNQNGVLLSMKCAII